jgi:hypothetical protein
VEREISLHSSVYEVEFWKRYRVMGAMLHHLNAQRLLIEELKKERVIPEQARDMALNAVGEELKQNISLFCDFLLNFISYGMQGLHKIDFEMRFLVLDKKAVEVERCMIHVNEKMHDVPFEVAAGFLEEILEKMTGDSRDSYPYQIIRYYEEYETYFDQMLGGNLERSGLEIMDEIFPRKCYHVMIRLPAQVLIQE